MKKKDTGVLSGELERIKDIGDFIVNNEEQFTKYTLAEYLDKLLQEKKLSKAEVIKASGLNQVYGYHIFAGSRKPSRNKVLAFALAMGLGHKEAQYLLQYAGVTNLYVRNKRDSVVIFALNKKLGVIAANQILFDLGEELIE